MDALKFITCGSVDDGKSTLIGRLLVDSRAVLQDQLAGVQRGGATDLALLTDGLAAEREQGITIDVAWRYFSTPARKFIIGDAPGHEQYTRNMVTAASGADAAVVLVDATKIDLSGTGAPALLPQTRRHTLLAHLLRVPHLVFAVNKLDAVADATAAFARIESALRSFAHDAGLRATAVVPISALRGDNVVDAAEPGWCGYAGETLLSLLERLPAHAQDDAAADAAPAFAVQWVEKQHDSADTSRGRRVFWGRVASGMLRVGQTLEVLPGGRTAMVAQVLSAVRTPGDVGAGHSAGVVLDRELDVSRGDWLLAPDAFDTARTVIATLAWLDDEPLALGRAYWALQGHRWVKAKVSRIRSRLDITTLARSPAETLEPNAIGEVELTLQEAVPVVPYAVSKAMGAMILVDTARHSTAAAVIVHGLATGA